MALCVPLELTDAVPLWLLVRDELCVHVPDALLVAVDVVDSLPVPVRLPLRDAVPVPLMVEVAVWLTGDGAYTTRMRLFPISEMKTFPMSSTATPRGLLSIALVAGPPSPPNDSDPVPANDVIIPVPASTRLMRWLERSAMKRLPPLSSANPVG